LIRRIATLGLGISPTPPKGATVNAITCRSAATPKPTRGAENAEIRCRIGAKSGAAFRRNHLPLSTEIRCRVPPIFAYVTKPFGIDELRARLRAALRHRLQQQGEQPVFRSGDLAVDLVRRVVQVRGEEVRLSPREYQLLRLLVAHAGKVLTHKFILREIWGGESNVQYLRIYIRSLRQKIEPDPERPDHVVTETGVGYRLRLLD
jgi:DNA-binding winged helix-turn-helix (wHTH) protein